MKYYLQNCLYKEIEDDVVNHYNQLISPIDSFAESHILESKHYRILIDEICVGCFSIHKGKVLTHFHLKDKYKNVSQEVFEKAKRFESVSEALVATCDEAFLSLSLDSYTNMKKQAYFFQYKNDVEIETSISMDYRIANIEDLNMIKENSDDFFGDSLEKQLNNKEIYIGFEEHNPIAFGVFERSRILKNHVSIGMYTKPEYRKMNLNVAKNV